MKPIMRRPVGGGASLTQLSEILAALLVHPHSSLPDPRISCTKTTDPFVGTTYITHSMLFYTCLHRSRCSDYD
jgi:hypothetical protein